MVLSISAACGCTTGKRRGNNEDNFYFDGHYLPAKNTGLEKILTCQYGQDKVTADFGVFDGMGGQADGQIASNLAAELFAGSVRKDAVMDSEEHCAYLQNVLKQISDAVWEQAEAAFTDMGTTAAVLRFSGDRCYAVNVGDSRTFLFRDAKLVQISRDHTDAEFLRDTGLMNRKPRLTQFIGINPDELTITPYVTSDRLLPDDLFLICSDGLTDMVPAEEIAAILASEARPAAKTERLLQRAMENGGRDNTTVILIQAGKSAAETEELLSTLPEDKTVVIERPVDHRGRKQDPQPPAGKGRLPEYPGRNMRQDDRTVYRAKDAVRGDRTAYRAQDADREDRPGTKTTVYILAVLVLILLISAGFTGMWLVGNRGDKAPVNAKTESTAESATKDDETADPAIEKNDEQQDPASDSASGNTKAGGIRLTEPNTSMN